MRDLCGMAEAQPASSSSASPQPPPRVAIATIWDGNARLACGIPLWCQGARLLARQIPRARVVLLSKQPSDDCAEALLLWSDETAAAAEAYVARHELRTSEVQTALLKFAMFSLHDRFDLVLQVDIDADLVPSYHPFRLPIWQRHVDAFMASQALFVGVPDHSSPVNGGVWLAKPRRWLYREALALLRDCSFSFADGFNGVGPPRGLRVSVDSLRLGAGGGNYAADLLNRTQMYEQNSWKFTGGSLDQGLLFYLLYLRHDAGTWATSASMRDRRDLWKVSHFWGPFKPWREAGQARNNYLKRFDLANATAARTACGRELAARTAALKREGKWERDDGQGWIPHEMPVLPSLDVVRFVARFASSPPPSPPPPQPSAAATTAVTAAAAAVATTSAAAGIAGSSSPARLPPSPAVAGGALLALACAAKAIASRRAATGHMYVPLSTEDAPLRRTRDL